jgi:hypothetical protein
MSKPRNMTIKGFIHKANGTKSAEGFLKAHADFINNIPALKNVVDQNQSPDATLLAVRLAAFDHMIQLANDALAANPKERKVASGTKVARVREQSAYLVTIYETRGLVNTVIEESGFAMLQQAENWAKNKIVEHMCATHAEIVATKLIKEDGSMMVFNVNRTDAIADKFKKGTGAVMKKMTYGSGLKFGVKAKNYVAHFSHG